MAKKILYDAQSVCNYLKEVVDKSEKRYIEAVAEQLYTDSDDLTYRDTGNMYNSGEIFSQFNKGIVTERMPYVRRRYYEGGKPGAGNRQAVPKWFEETFKKHKTDYETMYKKTVDKVKKEV